MLGVLANSGAVLVGGIVGLVFRGKINEKYTSALMAALARLKQWPELVLGENVGIHKWYSATSCPATLDVTYLVSKANEYMGNGFTYKSVEDGAAKPVFSTMASPTPTALIA